jgi:hypothetical protein
MPVHTLVILPCNSIVVLLFVGVHSQVLYDVYVNSWMQFSCYIVYVACIFFIVIVLYWNLCTVGERDFNADLVKSLYVELSESPVNASAVEEGGGGGGGAAAGSSGDGSV